MIQHPLCTCWFISCLTVCIFSAISTNKTWTYDIVGFVIIEICFFAVITILTFFSLRCMIKFPIWTCIIEFFIAFTFYFRNIAIFSYLTITDYIIFGRTFYERSITERFVLTFIPCRIMILDPICTLVIKMGITFTRFFTHWTIRTDKAFTYDIICLVLCIIKYFRARKCFVAIIFVHTLSTSGSIVVHPVSTSVAKLGITITIFIAFMTNLTFAANNVIS